MRITTILAAMAIASACTLTFLVGFGLGYDAGFYDDRMIAWPVILSPSGVRVVKSVADDSTTVLCIDNSPATTASRGILR
jgi:hypothetical protein